MKPTEILGVHQSDLVIRTALIEALRRMEDDPSLIDSVFESLAQDDLTNREYGTKQIELAKKWFLNTHLPVFLNFRVSELALPCIVISLMDSGEAEQTLGDVHYIPQEPTAGDWPPLTKPFTPTVYSPTSGLMQIPPAACGDLPTAVGLNVVTRTGHKYQIIDDLGDGLVALAPGITDDFTNAYLRNDGARYVTTIESVEFRETYQIGLHVMGEPTNLIFLHSIMVFALSKYKQELLEARNFERSVISSTDFRRNPEFDNELVFSRYINITGFARQYWPKDKREKITQVNTGGNGTPGIVIEAVGNTDESDPAVTEDGSAPDDDTAWSVRV